MTGAMGLTTQVTLLLLLALALAWLGRRGSPRTTHQLWTATFALVLVLPLLGMVAPSWEVPLLPARGGESPAAAIEAATSSDAPGSIATGGTAEVREAVVPAARARMASRAGGVRNASANAVAGRSLVGIAWIVWLVGCALSLAALAVAALRLRKLVRRAAPLRDPEWVREMAMLRRRLGLRGEVRLLSSEAVATPMTGGLWRPVILLPASAATWSRERRAVVLAHELIHVRRRDALRQLVRRIVLALHWFHPLCWAASRLATLASEKACDDAVLALGIRPSGYARHLVLLARGISRGPSVLALPIVHPSQLERRIVSILDRRRPHASVFRTALALTVIGTAGIFVAAARPGRTDVAMQPEPAIQESVRCSLSTDAARSIFMPGDGMIVENWHSGERAIDRFVEGMHLCLRENGASVMSDDGAAVQPLGADSWLVLESRAENVHRLVITGGSGRVEPEWRVNGLRRAFEAEGQQWRDLMLTVLRGSLEVWEIRSEEARLRDRISVHRGHVAGRRGLAEALEGQVVRLAGGGAAVEGRVGHLRSRITDIRAEMEAYDLDRKVREIRREIQALDAHARAVEVERTLQDEIAELQRLIG